MITPLHVYAVYFMLSVTVPIVPLALSTLEKNNEFIPSLREWKVQKRGGELISLVQIVGGGSLVLELDDWNYSNEDPPPV